MGTIATQCAIEQSAGGNQNAAADATEILSWTCSVLAWRMKTKKTGRLSGRDFAPRKYSSVNIDARPW